MKSSTQSIKKVIGIGIIGNVLEWYDLTIYGYFSAVLAKLFFPNDNFAISLLYTFSVFAISFLIRPLGALLFGLLGDRLGRKKALFFSLMLICIPTTLMGLIPTYQQIGVFAPILLILLRVLQGLSIGGEFSSSILFLTENAPKNRKGFLGSFVFFGAGIGWLLGSLVCALTNHYFSEQTLHEWGWRVPFLFGSLTGIFGLYLRSYAKETDEFIQLEKTKGVSKSPLKELYASSKQPLFITVGLGALSAIGGYLIYAYIPTYLNQVVKMPLKDALFLNTISLAAFTSLVPIAGRISDQVGKKNLFLVSSLGILLLAVPIFYLLQMGSYFVTLLALLTFAPLMALFQAPYPAAMHELFPTSIRASAVAIGYNIATALFAGTCPLICTLLITVTGNSYAPAYYLMLAASITFIVALFHEEPNVVLVPNK